jgi:hypothetical protein
MATASWTRDELYVRSWKGEDAEGGVDDAVDAAYRDKYGRYPSYVPPMVSARARATTLRLVPHAGRGS